jgi:Rrf2 family nitric oxide-sensitive transcriptional repressor
MFSQTAEYALRTVVWIAAQQGTPRTTQRIAEATRIPAGYLAKVLQMLTRGKLLNSQRGINGGFTLARPAEAISARDVVDVVDPIRRIERCPLGIESHKEELCPLHHRLDEAISSIEAKLEDTKISDLLKTAPSESPFCE